MFERELNAYCAEAERFLQCGRADQKRFRRHIRDCTQDYLNEQPGAAFDEVRGMLGEPQEAAALFMDTLPEGTVQRWRKARRHRRRLPILVLALAIALLAGLLIRRWRARAAVLVTTETTITDYGESYDESSLHLMPTPEPPAH